MNNIYIKTKNLLFKRPFRLVVVYNRRERLSITSKLAGKLYSLTLVDNHDMINITIIKQKNKRVITSSPTPSINAI